MRRLPLLLVAALAGSCSGSIQATVSGIDFPARDAIFFTASLPDGGAGPAVVWITSSAQMCSHVTQEQGIKNEQLLSLSFTPAATGTFAVQAVAGPSVILTYLVDDLGCAASVATSEATSGIVTISTLFGTRLTGEFDVTLAPPLAPQEDAGLTHLTGSFTATACPALALYSASSPAWTCQLWATACTAPSCLGCCDASGNCQPGSSPSACGVSGAFCQACPLGACSANRCSAACSAATCHGCCDSEGTCQPGTNPSACGPIGGSCAACSGAQTCDGGTCS
jgi:hypothetical protein